MGKKIVVIDDSNTIRNITVNYFKETEFTIFPIGEFDNILKRLKQIKPSVILLDIYLGDKKINGYSISKEIREDDELSSVPIIMMSGSTDNIDIEQAFESGSNVFLKKPFSKEELLDIVEELIIEKKRDETVLIIDDSMTSRKVVRLELEKGGFDVMEAESGSKGIDILKREKVNLIILDIEMEGMNGFEVARLINEDDSIYAGPIIMLSGIDDPVIIKKGFEAGIVEYFTKPFIHGRLLNFVTEIFESLKKEKSRKVVVLDDSRVQRSVFRFILERGGKEVIEFGNPLKALDYINENKDISLIISDIYMPELNGFEFAKKSKTIQKYTPIIGVSSRRSKESVLKALSSGMDDFIYLPIYEEELNLRVDTQIKLYEKLKELDKANTKLKELSTKDPLTMLYNRRAMFELFNAEFKRALRNQTELSVMMIDIDHFKKVNDTYGHNKGDEVLKDVATIFKESTREYDIISRYGGEEFLIICPATGKENSKIVSERIRKKVEFGKPGGIQLSVSIGLASLNEIKEKDMNNLIKLADDRVYIAKEEGRNRIISS